MTLDSALAVIGGFSASLWYFLSIILTSYQEFSYNNALAARLFTREKKRATRIDDDSDSSARIVDNN